MQLLSMTSHINLLHNCYTLITYLIAILFRIPMWAKNLIAKDYFPCELSTLWVYFFSRKSYHDTL